MMQGDGPVPPQRRWPRRLLLGLNIFVAVCLVAAGSVYGYVAWRFGQIKRVDVPSLGRDSQGRLIEPLGQSLTFLVVGSDSRAGISKSDVQSFGSAAAVAGARSDTIMLVHINPATGSASLLSIPRDLWVPIPGKGYSARINIAFDGGPDLLVRAIQDNLGIAINHYVDVDFVTFREVVAALGGVKFWYPEPVHDTYSGLNITTPGCYGLSGEMALSLVRARHMTYQENGRWINELESDLARIRRQQLFVKALFRKAQASGVLEITKINGVIGGIVNNITVDSGLSQSLMLKLARRYRNFNPTNLATMTLPTTQASVVANGVVNDVLYVQQSEGQAAIDQFLGVLPPTTTTTAPAGPVPNIDPSTVQVRVLNGSGRSGEAGLVTGELRQAGFVTGPPGSAPTYDNQTSAIQYPPGAEAQARFLQSVVGGGATLQPQTGTTGSGLVFVTGQSFTGIHMPGSTTSSTSTSTTAPAAASAKAAFPGIHGSDPPPPGSGC